ncbi:MAG: hypothetical protein FOGNACKC_03440 [Anaerolineae bacterium]|nr:hypothetical protein [Anaerolineae bacterium]
MSKHTHIQRQRQLLKAFSLANKKRAELENSGKIRFDETNKTANTIFSNKKEVYAKSKTDAETRKRNELETAGKELEQIRKKASDTLAIANTSDSAALKILNESNLAAKIVLTPASKFDFVGKVEPFGELSRNSNEAARGVDELNNSVKIWKQWRFARDARQQTLRALLFGAIIIVLILLGGVGYYVYRSWTIKQHYDNANIALDQGKFEEALAELEQVLAIDENYEPAKTLLYETYYQAAKMAVEAEEWDSAIAEIDQLKQLNPDYKDISSLLESNDKFQKYLSSFASTRWFDSNNIVSSTIYSHDDKVNSVAFSSDGQTLTSGANDRIVRLWTIYKNELATSLKADGEVSSVAFGPNDPNLLAVGLANKAIVQLWQLKNGVSIQRLTGHDKTIIYDVAFSPNGEFLASGGNDNTIRVWKDGGKTVYVLGGHSNSVTTVSFSPDGDILASGSIDGTVRLWNVFTGEYIDSLQGNKNTVNDLVFSPDGNILVVGSADGFLRVWNVNSKKLESQIKTTSPTNSPIQITSISFNPVSNPYGDLLASGLSNGEILLWQLKKTGEISQSGVLKGHKSKVNSVAFSPDGLVLASGSDDQTVRLWQPQYSAASASTESNIVAVTVDPANSSGSASKSDMIPANTPAPTEKPAATKRPTNTPKPTVTPTKRPKSTPRPTATSTPKPQPTKPTITCRKPPQGEFANLWGLYKERLGCPFANEVKPLYGQFADMPFEKGHLFWIGDVDVYGNIRQVIATFGGQNEGDTGTWSIRAETWNGEGICNVSSPPDGRYLPDRGIAKVWCELDGINSLGFAMAPVEFSAGRGINALQNFEKAIIFRDSDGYSKGLAYVLFRDNQTYIRVRY